MLDILDLSTSLKSIKDTKLASAVAATGNWGSTQMQTVKDILNCRACEAGCWQCAFPHLTTCTSSLCVYDNTNYFRCGKCCNWTVPAGATKAKFELWGAGSGSGAGICCGGSPTGASGAYATIIIPVTAGCQYTLCAGCAHSAQSYCTAWCGDLSGCKSFVVGYGLTNLCADGGCFNLMRAQIIRNRLCGPSADGSCCMFKAPRCCASAVGVNICGPSCLTLTTCIFGHYLCQQASLESCGIIPVMPDCLSTFYGTPFGYASMLGGACWDTNYYGYDIAPPTLTAVNGYTAGGCCCYSWSSGTCCGTRAQACCQIRCFPGAGGTPTHVMGGSLELYGDWGRTGMIKVSWV